MHVTADVFRCQRVKKLSAVNRKLFRIQTLPLYYSMTDQDVEDVIAAVTRIAEYYKI